MRVSLYLSRTYRVWPHSPPLSPFSLVFSPRILLAPWRATARAANNGRSEVSAPIGDEAAAHGGLPGALDFRAPGGWRLSAGGVPIMPPPVGGDTRRRDRRGDRDPQRRARAEPSFYPDNYVAWNDFFRRRYERELAAYDGPPPPACNNAAGRRRGGARRAAPSIVLAHIEGGSPDGGEEGAASPPPTIGCSSGVLVIREGTRLIITGARPQEEAEEGGRSVRGCVRSRRQEAVRAESGGREGDREVPQDLVPARNALPMGAACASNELWRIILEGFKPYNPDKLTRREAVDSQLNNTALYMIQTSVGTKDLHRVRNYTTAKEAWDGLAASCIGSESTRRNKYNALKNKAEGFMRLPDEDHEVMYGRLLTVADAFRLIGATHINDSWIKEKYIECMMPFVPIDVKTLVGRECYSSLTSQQVVHEMQALKVLEETSHDSRNRALGMAKGSNLALVVNSIEEVIPQESYRASWSMSYPEDLQCHYHDHMAFHAKSFWVDPSKAKEDNIKRNNKSGFTSFGPKTRSCYNCDDKRHFIAECPYENRELHNGRLIPKDKSKDTKGKYSKAPNKKFYNNKTKKGKRPSRVVLVTREEYSSDEVESSSGDEDEESSKELAAIVTTNIPSSSLFESPQ
ncbi:hypothetical protein QYE76_033966 [Lolium multiflorum]|uniref:CCHC-type domain-containing protein n=1 Tax=Lolium multiflorum TaxID=4521 RepID=A0AAD8VMV1_LOLMU|nr:hypothetical protein QYE76_033966 [Lolium multiflorum]